MAKRQKTTRFSIQGFDLNHYRTTEQYAAAVQALFDRATLAIAQSATRRNIDPDKPFSFDDYPEVKTELQKVVGQLASRLQTTIETGSKNQWLFACEKNDGFIASIMDTSKLSKARLKKMQDRNLDALSTFQGRKVGGMDLSQRVWRYVGQFRDQLETALDVGLGEGRSAQQLARDVKKNLREPDRLFRRVRDKRGNLVLSKAARAFHPGQGVYRSSVKNAQRLTRSEINMAYRESDFLRWQQLDFVVGFEIHRSNHEPLCKCKICDRLQGRYPKTFKFKGWHPQCMCYAVPILMDEETFDENELGDLKAALRGTEYKKKQAKNLVTDVPDGFKEWVAENMEASAGWSSTPYFIKDNFVDGDLSKGLKIALPEPEIDPMQAQLDALMPSIEAARKIAKEWGLDIQLNALDKAVANREISKINERIATITSKANQLVSMLQKYVNDVADVTKSAKDGGVDIMKLPEFSIVTQNLIAAKADKKNWKNNFGTYQNNLESLKRAIQDELLRRKQEEEKKKSAADTETSMDDWRKRTEEAGTVTKSENDKEIETVLGIDKGVDMTFEESNDLRGNPNYAEQWLECDQKEATHSMTRDGKKVYIRKNPAYKKKYTINCQSCVVAHELRRRGFDVQAIGKTPNSIPAILSRHTELAWLDADGKTPTSTSVSWAWQSDKDAMAKSMVANLETATKAVGRYHLKWTWATGSSGHIITCERLKDGTLRIYDPQCGQIITDFATYGKRFEHGTLKILRVDNLRFNPLYAGCLKGNKAKKKKK